MFCLRWSYGLLLLVFLGCRRDVEEFQPYAPTTSELSALLSNRVPQAAAVSTFTLSNLATDKVLETSAGVQVFLVDTDQLFGEQGSGIPVPCSTCPDLKIEVTEVFNKGEILARGLHTVADSGKVFESAGMVQIKAHCGGKTLELLPGRNLKVHIPSVPTAADFWVFGQGSVVNNPWNSSTQPVYEAEWPAANGSIQVGHELLLGRLGWSAAGRFLDDPVSSFCIQMPTGFGEQNTLSYVVFKDRQVVIPLGFDLGKNLFCFSRMPVGFLIQPVAVSKLGNHFYLGKGQTEVGTNAIFPLSTQIMTEEAVVNFVKGL